MPSDLSAAWNTIAGAFLGFGAAVFAEPLRQWIYRPKLKLEFGDDPGCRARTPEQVEAQLPQGKRFNTHQAEYIRIKVSNTKPAIAKNCIAYLVAIEKADMSGLFESTIYCDSIPLAWSCRGDVAYSPVDLPRGVAQYIDVVSTRAISKEIRPEIRTIPFRYRNIFKEHGTFRFTIQVSGENVKPAFIKIIFTWSGIWDSYDAKRD